MSVHKGMSKTVLYVGLIILAIGAFMYFKPKPIFGGMAVFIVGALISIFWFANRNDEKCVIDENDNEVCTPVKK